MLHLQVMSTYIVVKENLPVVVLIVTSQLTTP